jgi:hypothetical protein
MLRNLHALVGGGVANANAILTGYTPLQLGNFLEASWNAPRSRARQWRLPQTQSGVGRLALNRAMARPSNQFFGPGLPLDPAQIDAPIAWSHLIYAYMVENTGIVEIFRRVLQTWLTDETLPYPSQETQYWIRASEDLFFKTPSSFFHSTASSLRPDPDSIRANAYKRLFGLELGPNFNGNGSNNGTSPAKTPAIANTEFTMVFERLLCEVWNGFVYRAQNTAPNAADNQAMLQLVRSLREMLLARRTNGSLMREEFEAVAMLSWFHLTVQHDTYIVNDLDAQSTSAANRLRRIGSLVDVTPAAAADSYFQLADSMSTALMAIESGLVETALRNDIPVLTDPNTNRLADVMQNILTHWSIITGRSFKVPVTAVLAYPFGLASTFDFAPADSLTGAPTDTAALPPAIAPPAPALRAAAPSFSITAASRVSKTTTAEKRTTFVGSLRS